MHGADSHGGGGRRGEDEVQLASDVDDEELAERDSGEETEEGANEGAGQDTAPVPRGVVGERLAPVHGRETGDEETGHTTGTGSSSLDDGVLLGTKVHAEEGNLGEDLCEDTNLQA